ncbi:uncharacterized protein AB675_6778 [Cyphellophora attinorum]|uniref:Uncharacterized protein n=1 Tax=Cyphellophora attinorum TaxID=1664694 RepID=A0A0N1P0A2_9EURO|nr:uncharacterized protein AB675_6778 [Phialophora attinorum]KPI43236.1 hypothetical protein AB675_6778 [Phialophora attinorum]
MASKRKRDVDDISDEEMDHQFKQRRTLPALPIRTTPPKFARRFGSTLASSVPPAPLTPIDTSEDESLTDEYHDVFDGDRWKHISQGSSISTNSTSSLKVNVDLAQHGDDKGMMLSPPPPRPRFGRARSNDLVSPAHLTTSFPSLTAPSQPNQLNDRMPTPVASSFDNRTDSRGSVLSQAPRQSFPPLRKFLSPMMEQDAWGTSNEGGLPSPVEDSMQYDSPISADVLMGYEQTSAGMIGLNMSCDDDKMMEDTPSLATAQLDGQTRVHARQHSRGKGSIAKLHMGFLAGCSKCEQKVPGHYSHILRT